MMFPHVPSFSIKLISGVINFTPTCLGKGRSRFYAGSLHFSQQDGTTMQGRKTTVKVSYSGIQWLV